MYCLSSSIYFTDSSYLIVSDIAVVCNVTKLWNISRFHSNSSFHLDDHNLIPTLQTGNIVNHKTGIIRAFSCYSMIAIDYRLSPTNNVHAGTKCE